MAAISVSLLFCTITVLSVLPSPLHILCQTMYMVEIRMFTNQDVIKLGLLPL